MIHAVLIFNTHGKPRLSKFYTPIPPLTQQALISQIFSFISDRPAGVCNFLDAPELVFPAPPNAGAASNGNGNGNGGNGKGKSTATSTRDDDTRVIYRHYATLYFVFVVDGAESELGILDLIQVFVESLDRAFENVCELDLIFHFDEVQYVLNEIIQGGLVLETNINEINLCVQASKRNRKASAASANPLLPSMLVAPGAGRGRGDGGGGARGWLASIGV
ncbi:Sigma-adaptin 3A [Apiotrichum porosum]|uniref:AP complex subunit sigma n=1 Tax=Apiotrichum porosum TaxID=105984 RepID=A0A427Y6H8_9TREE|nr:Sigma-adaptin 3A [Apiotrichum porosum]RSH86664.1 Sigma-adaptin 3A [Apiotrichum porosum]